MKKKTNRMTKTVICLTIDQEEEYLNKMCAHGWKPVKIMLGLWFTFEKCEPGEYIVRVTTGIDPKGRKASRERRERMIEFLTDSGAEIVPEINVDAKTRIYAVRPARLGKFEINTDIDALIADYTARRRYHIAAVIFTFLFFVFGLVNGICMAVLLRTPEGSGSVPHGAYIEFATAALLLVIFVCLLVPIPSYTRKIRKLREKRQIEE